MFNHKNNKIMIEKLGLKLLSAKEVADLLGVKPPAVQRAARLGKLTGKTFIKGRAYYSEENVKAYLQGRSSSSKKETDK